MASDKACRLNNIPREIINCKPAAGIMKHREIQNRKLFIKKHLNLKKLPFNLNNQRFTM